ncbi:hypothetical protein COT99_04010 [Candidatus Falkowbacteria bacterium CG10_big_fil_rev_8_21_14_0_10_43_10]|uniref:Fibronectin type-III domain-containing protein n=1 Tax=Candidatus Falkowbacteria bacterium CG10_big_fil_rev_8_21_14_0_10_43_10 TaxID=1974567 RepID=A0A2H0V1C3_9BACT|nr:MAG: hypothetical protein COT99_04010 [Candidatus Falkowbacteria bacterium CG10_big_fil_rev_8_21_14_0_10_43_10]
MTKEGLKNYKLKIKLMSFLKKLGFILSFCLLAVIAASFIFIADPPAEEIAQAGTADNVYGWAWSGNIGWVSFNCIQQYCSGNPAIRCSGESDCAGMGTCEFDDQNCSTSNYGVDYNEDNGELSGYAGSENAGWIYFGRSGGDFPAGGTSQWAKKTGGNVLGWAQIVNMSLEGWLWMDHAMASPVTVSDYEFSGWAWNENDDGTGIGWLSFNCANQAECGVSDYKVFISNAPSATGLSENFSSACSGAGISVTLSWSFNDSDPGSSQSTYELEVRDSSGVVVFDSGKKQPAPIYTDEWTVSSGLNYNETYNWRVKVWDNYNLASAWANDSFVTPAHQYPAADFTWGPSSGEQGTTFSPKALENVYFAGASTAYGGASISSTTWAFTGALPNASTTPNPGPVQFQGSGVKEVVLTVTDSDGYSCPVSKNITTKMSLPIWKEIKPE